MSDFYGSLGRLANQWQSVIAPHVTPRVIVSGNREDIAGPGARALTVGRGGRATKATSYSPADLALPPSLAGDLNPQLFARAQEALARDVPASGPTSNPPLRMTYRATPIKMGDLISTLSSQAEKDEVLPLPPERDLAFLIDGEFAKLNHHGVDPTYHVSRLNEFSQRFGGMRVTTGTRVNHSIQEARLVMLPGANELLTRIELDRWQECDTLQEYEDSFMEYSARNEFLNRFTLAGGVYSIGNDGGSGVHFHRTGGMEERKLVDITTAGPFDCFDYANGYGNVENASCNLVIARRPVKSGVDFDLGWNAATSSPGTYRRRINFASKGIDEMGKYADTIYPVQVSIAFWPDGDRLPRTYVDPIQGPHYFGSSAIKIGKMTFRNIGNIGFQPTMGFQNLGQTHLYIRPPATLSGYPPEQSTYKIAQRRPIQLHLNGNPH